MEGDTEEQWVNDERALNFTCGGGLYLCVCFGFFLPTAHHTTVHRIAQPYRTNNLLDAHKQHI